MEQMQEKKYRKGGPDGRKETCTLVGISPDGNGENSKRVARCSVLGTSGQSLFLRVKHRPATVQAKAERNEGKKTFFFSSGVFWGGGSVSHSFPSWDSCCHTLHVTVRSKAAPPSGMHVANIQTQRATCVSQ